MEKVLTTEAAMTTFDAIMARRSIRKFKPDPVEEEKITLVVHAATLAPSGMNTQPWDFVAVTDPETMLQVSDLVLGGHRRLFGEARAETMAGAELDQQVQRFSRLAQAPVFIVVCLNRKRKHLKAGFDHNADFWDILGVGAAMENLILAATSLGLGTCWMGSIALREDALKELLSIPSGARIAGILALGYPDEMPNPRPRDPLESVLHRNRW